MTIYKVVHKSRLGLFSAGLTSVEKPFYTQYFLSEFVYPPKEFPNAWFFAYDDLDAAIRFRGDRNNRAVYIIETTEFKELRGPFPGIYLPAMKKYWRNKLVTGTIMTYTPNTVLCKDVKLVELVIMTKKRLEAANGKPEPF